MMANNRCYSVVLLNKTISARNGSKDNSNYTNLAELNSNETNKQNNIESKVNLKEKFLSLKGKKNHSYHGVNIRLKHDLILLVALSLFCYYLFHPSLVIYLLYKNKMENSLIQREFIILAEANELALINKTIYKQNDVVSLIAKKPEVVENLKNSVLDDNKSKNNSVPLLKQIQTTTTTNITKQETNSTANYHVIISNNLQNNTVADDNLNFISKKFENSSISDIKLLKKLEKQNNRIGGHNTNAANEVDDHEDDDDDDEDHDHEKKENVVDYNSHYNETNGDNNFLTKTVLQEANNNNNNNNGNEIVTTLSSSLIVNQTGSMVILDSSKTSTIVESNLTMTTNTSDDDIVISSSEILADNNDFSFKSSRHNNNEKNPPVLQDSILQNNNDDTNNSMNNSGADIGTTLTKFSNFDSEAGMDQLMEKSKLKSLLRNSSTTTATMRDEEHLSNSRLLLRLLAFGLLCLITISLSLVYTIKLCVCRRRKRLFNLQRNLVSDLNFDLSPISSSQHSNHSFQQQHPQCSCPIITTVPSSSQHQHQLQLQQHGATRAVGELQPRQRANELNHNNTDNSNRPSYGLIDTILGSILKRFRFFDTSTRYTRRQRQYQRQLYRRQLMLRGNSINSIYERLTLSERLALHQLVRAASPIVGYNNNNNNNQTNNVLTNECFTNNNNDSLSCTAGATNNLNCSVCLANNHTTSGFDHLILSPNVSNQFDYLLSRPPTYSELFGLRSTASLEVFHSDQAQTQHLPALRSRIEEGPEEGQNLPPYEQAIGENRTQQQSETIVINDDGDEDEAGAGAEDCLNTLLEEHRECSNNESNFLSQELASGEQIEAQQQQNLLVKLNLNKTKLLSAGDLMLLSKIIDVPIVVQNQQSQAQELDAGRSEATEPSANCQNNETVSLKACLSASNQNIVDNNNTSNELNDLQNSSNNIQTEKVSSKSVCKQQTNSIEEGANSDLNEVSYNCSRRATISAGSSNGSSSTGGGASGATFSVGTRIVYKHNNKIDDKKSLCESSGSIE